MKWPPCDREPEVMEAVESGRLAELEPHISTCAACADLVVVLQAMRRESDAAFADVRVPSSGLVWWKAQRRAQLEAAQEAVRPVSVAEKIAYVFTLVGLIAALAWEWPQMGRLVSGLDVLGSLAQYNFSVSLPSFLSLQSTFALGIGAAVICLMAFVVYAAVAEK
jgi:hypothetical protein